MMTLAELLQRSQRNLDKLHPFVKAGALKTIEKSFYCGIYIVITQGYRSIDYQNKLYAQGRTAPGNIVTNAKGGRSYHNYGLAWDFALLIGDGKMISYDTRRHTNNSKFTDWMVVVRIAIGLGFEWGGHFKTIVDMPHFQMSFGLSINDLQQGIKPPEKLLVDVDDREGEVTMARKDMNVTINGKKIDNAFVEDGVTYLSAREVARALNATLSWKGEAVVITSPHGESK